MKVLSAVSLLAFCVLGVMTAPAAAQVIGPVCLEIVEFEELAQVFALPTADGQVILTGQSLTFGDAYSGSGYVSDSSFTFTLASGLLPGLLEGVIDLSTNQGTGTVTFADTGETQTLTYAITLQACEVPAP